MRERGKEKVDVARLLIIEGGIYAEAERGKKVIEATLAKAGPLDCGTALL